MDGKIKLLEERVTKVVGRLRELSAERKQLEKELQSLRKSAESAAKGGKAGTGKGQEEWRAQRVAVVETIRRTLDELRDA